MSRLYEALNRRQSQDVIRQVELPVAREEESRLERRIREEAGPVRTTLDLSNFLVFNKSSQRATKGEFWIKVDSKGGVYLSHEIGKQVNWERVEILLNRKGTIIVVREGGDEGLKLYGEGHGNRTKAKRAGCTALAHTLKKLGVQLPVKFKAEYDPELQAWVGRR